jgi:hypothetical protein
VLLGVSEGEAGVDLQGLAGGVAAVGLDERVVDALGLEPGEQEVAQRVRADRGGDARGLGVPGEDLADAAVAVGLLPARLEQEGVPVVLGKFWSDIPDLRLHVIEYPDLR